MLKELRSWSSWSWTFTVYKIWIRWRRDMTTQWLGGINDDVPAPLLQAAEFDDDNLTNGSNWRGECWKVVHAKTFLLTRHLHLKKRPNRLWSPSLRRWLAHRLEDVLARGRWLCCLEGHLHDMCQLLSATSRIQQRRDTMTRLSWGIGGTNAIR